MFRLAALFGLIGLAVATGVIAYSGYHQMLTALSVAGWGILWTSLYHLVPLLCSSIGWRALLPGRKTTRQKPALGFFVYVMWLRSSVNGLMPVARIGGEVVAVRVMTRRGMRNTAAIASTIVELTMSVLAVFVFDVTGIGLFAWRIADRQLGWHLLLGLLLAIPPVSALVVVQRFGFFGLLARIFTLMFRDRWTQFAGSAARLDRAVHAMYRRTGRILACGFWQLLTWFAGTGEVWLALYFLGDATSIPKALMLEALIQASASLAFAIPGALGVQEAGFLLFGHMLGLPADICAALAVMRRCRDLLLFVPGLIVWQAQEGAWLLRRKNPAI